MKKLHVLVEGDDSVQRAKGLLRRKALLGREEEEITKFISFD